MTTQSERDVRLMAGIISQYSDEVGGISLSREATITAQRLYNAGFRLDDGSSPDLDARLDKLEQRIAAVEGYTGLSFHGVPSGR